jgi:hypothetical protein
MKRSSSWGIFKPTKEKLGWKPVKSSEPDPGSYETLSATKNIKTRYPNYSMPRSKSLKFTVEYSNNKKHVPGAGNYNPEKCFKSISRPYMKKRS